MKDRLKIVNDYFLGVKKGEMLNKTSDGSYEFSRESKTIHNGIQKKTEVRVSISAEQAEDLIKKNILEEVDDDSNNNSHVNVFDEIERLIDVHKNELNSLDDKYKDSPLCMKVEAQTVLTNLIKILEYLFSLKR